MDRDAGDPAGGDSKTYCLNIGKQSPPPTRESAAPTRSGRPPPPSRRPAAPHPKADRTHRPPRGRPRRTPATRGILSRTWSGHEGPRISRGDMSSEDRAEQEERATSTFLHRPLGIAGRARIFWRWPSQRLRGRGPSCASPHHSYTPVGPRGGRGLFGEGGVPRLAGVARSRSASGAENAGRGGRPASAGSTAAWPARARSARSTGRAPRTGTGRSSANGTLPPAPGSRVPGARARTGARCQAERPTPRP